MTETTETIEQETYSTAVVVTLRGKDGSERQVTVVAEDTETPGLVVMPALYGGRMSGHWALTHAASGLGIPVGWDADDLDTVKAIAAALGRTPVDWTAGLDEVKAQIAEHKDAIVEARRDGRYPPADADSPWDGEPSEGPGAYPGNEAQATADAIARALTKTLQHRAKETHELVRRDDPDGRAIFLGHVGAKVAEWALVLALREFAKVDRQAADWTARQMWTGWEAGDSIDEEVWVWAREYGLPEPADEETPATAGEPANG